jgi:hypothetical protein
VIVSAPSLEAHEFDPLYTARYGDIYNYFGSILVAFGHIGVVMLVAKSGTWEVFVDRVAAVGRMALSNYLTHSLLYDGSVFRLRAGPVRGGATLHAARLRRRPDRPAIARKSLVAVAFSLRPG